MSARSNSPLDSLADLEAHRRTVDTTAGPVSCLDVGQGPVVLFLHGLGTNALFWRHALAALAGERRCVALDLPLHGHTPAAPGQDLSLGGLASVVEAFYEAAELGPIDLVAHDTGGALGQIVAATHPEWLRSLCLASCDTHDNVPPEAFKPTIELAAAGLLSAGAADLLADLPVAREAVFAMGYQDVENLPLEVVGAFLEPLMGTPGRARQFEQLLVGLGPDDLLAVEADLARLTVPTRIVWAADDEFFELSWAYWLDELIPGSTGVDEVAGAKLFFPDERADDLVALLRTHWAAVDALPAAS
jgi:pimeloyl-ACP methyl ester carboxylesterase